MMGLVYDRGDGRGPDNKQVIWVRGEVSRTSRRVGVGEDEKGWMTVISNGGGEWAGWNRLWIKHEAKNV